jgi:acyl-coenzyme A thioesterase PaaI-like protein
MTDTIGQPLSERAEFYRTLGLKVLAAADGTATVEMAEPTGFRNSRGDLHGGAVLALADIAASNAVRSLLPPGDGLYGCGGRVVSLGGRTAFAAIDVRSGDEVVANGVATIRVFRGPSKG